MFQYIVGGAAALAFGAIAAKEMSKTTGEKVKDGDTLFVRADKLHLADTNAPADVAGFQAFLAGFLNTSVKVTMARLTPKSTGITGTIIGFPKVVAFDRADVTSIERDGKKIV